MHLRAIYWFLSLLNIYFTLLAELIETGPMRALICETGLFDQDKIQITMKISSLMTFQIIDHELCVCEYGLWIFFDSEVEVEAAKGVQYRRLMLRARFLKILNCNLAESASARVSV